MRMFNYMKMNNTQYPSESPVDNLHDYIALPGGSLTSLMKEGKEAEKFQITESNE